MRSKYFLFLLAVLPFFVTGCSSSKNEKLHVIKIEASSVPQAQMLEYVKPELKEQGIDLQIIVVDDYNIPNRALADKEVDANFFQHIPYLEEQIKQFHYPLCVLAKTHIEPIGLYSKKVKSLQELSNGSTIAIPNDPTNEARALLLLQRAGLIKLNSENIYNITPMNISQNPHQFVFKEIDAALLPRTLDDVNAAIIPTNYALQAGFSPLKDALLLEDQHSPYVNVIVIRCEEQNQADLLILKKDMNSESMRQYILETYKGAVIPAF
jgi:D-methionine transport system substrate-binding protein